MRLKYNFIIFLLGAFIVALAFKSCKKDDLDEDKYNQKVRLIRPVDFQWEPDGTTITFTWTTISKSVGYAFQFSDDSLEFENIIVDTTVNSGTVVIKNVESGKLYSARVRALNTDTTYNSKWAEILIDFPQENLFTKTSLWTVKADTIIANWYAGSEVTKLVFETEEGIFKEFTLTSAEITAGSKLVDGLNHSTLYTIKIYNGNLLRGVVQVSTKISIEGAIYVTPDSSIANVIMNSPDSSIILFASGVYREIAETDIVNRKYLRLMAENPQDKPELHSKVLNIKGDVGTILIENLEFSGIIIDTLGNKTGETNYSYFMDFTADAFKTVDSIIVTGCVLRNFSRAMMRAKLGSTITDPKVNVIKFDDCIMNDLTQGNQEIFDFRDVEVTEFIITNSTAYVGNPTRKFIRLDKGNSILYIDHCTFYDLSNDVAYDFIRNLGASGSNTIKNSIMANIAGTFEFSLTATFDITNNNYFNADKLQGHASNGTVVYNIDPGFTDAANGDFTLPSNSQLRGKATDGKAIGDPRWAE